MALPLSHTLSRNITRDKILNGSYPNVRIHGIEGNMNPFQPWATLKAALADRPTPSPGDKHGCDLEPGSGKCDSDSSQLMSFSSTCFYYGISLSEELEMSTGAPPPPIGMVHTSFGGSSIEQWLTNETIATCANASIGPTNQVCVCVFVCAHRLPLLPLLPVLHLLPLQALLLPVLLLRLRLLLLLRLLLRLRLLLAMALLLALPSSGLAGPACRYLSLAVAASCLLAVGMLLTACAFELLVRSVSIVYVDVARRTGDAVHRHVCQGLGLVPRRERYAQPLRCGKHHSWRHFHTKSIILSRQALGT